MLIYHIKLQIDAKKYYEEMKTKLNNHDAFTIFIPYDHCYCFKVIEKARQMINNERKDGYKLYNYQPYSKFDPHYPFFVGYCIDFILEKNTLWNNIYYKINCHLNN